MKVFLVFREDNYSNSHYLAFLKTFKNENSKKRFPWRKKT